MPEYKEYKNGLLILNQYRARRDPISFFSEMAREGGDFCSIDFWVEKYYLVNDPTLIRELLVEKSNEVIIKGGVSSGLARLIGHGILTNRGEEWRQSRTTLNPLFAAPKIIDYIQRISACCEESITRWRSLDRFELNHELLTMILRANCAWLFKYLPTFAEAEQVAGAILNMQRLMSWLPLPHARALRRARNIFSDFAERVQSRGVGISEAITTDEILSLLFAGSEAPATTLCWVAVQLAKFSDWRAKLRREIKSFAIEPISLELLKKHVECENFLNEVMRLYPSGWAFERYADTDLELRGVKIKKGARFIISPYLLHRNKKYWVEPERFNPERFRGGAPVDEMAKPAHIPFGLGPRSCIGSRLAMSEMLIFIILLLRKHEFNFEANALDDLRPMGSFKLRLGRPVFARIV